MDCSNARTWIFRRMDGNLPAEESAGLDAHIAVCASCARDLKLLLIPRRIAQALPVFKPSPFFYTRLRARIAESENQSVTIWQIILMLSRHMVPALAAITLALLSVFAYFQFTEPQADVYQAYDRIFMSGDRPQRMVIADQGEITDESVLRAIAEEETTRRQPTGAETVQK
jgi:anti-sigma factor RsiW